MYINRDRDREKKEKKLYLVNDRIERKRRSLLSSEHNLKFNTIYTAFKCLESKCKYLQQSVLYTLCFSSHVYNSVYYTVYIKSSRCSVHFASAWYTCQCKYCLSHRVITQRNHSKNRKQLFL